MLYCKQLEKELGKELVNIRTARLSICSAEAVANLEGVEEVFFPADMDRDGKDCIKRLRSTTSANKSPPAFQELPELKESSQGSTLSCPWN